MPLRIGISPFVRSLIGVLAAVIIATAGNVQSAEIAVMISGGFSAAYKELISEFEKTSGNRVVTAWGPSMGTTPEAIPNRLARGESVDVLIMVGAALDELIRTEKVVRESRRELAKSGIGMAVRAGTPKPSIGSVEDLKQALMNAKSIAYSDSASGVYLSGELFPRLGLSGALRDKARMIPGEPVGAVIARGDAELGFQQISELLPIPGIELVGPLPPEVQKITPFAAGIAAVARQPQAGRELIDFLGSPGAAPAIRRAGMEPAEH